MTFRFSLDSLLQRSRHLRDQAGAALGQANLSLRTIEQQIETVELRRQQFRQQQSAKRIGRLSIETLQADNRYQTQLQDEIDTLNRSRVHWIEKTDQLREQLRQAQTEMKQLEQLQQRQRERYRADALRRETIESDELAAFRHALKPSRWGPAAGTSSLNR